MLDAMLYVWICVVQKYGFYFYTCLWDIVIDVLVIFICTTMTFMTLGCC